MTAFFKEFGKIDVCDDQSSIHIYTEITNYIIVGCVGDQGVDKKLLKDS